MYLDVCKKAKNRAVGEKNPNVSSDRNTKI